jgi:hypothetical protein
MSMKKTDLYKNLALTTAQRMKNAAKTPRPGTAEDINPMLASLMVKTKSK